jgi:hypothetical protein
MKSLPFLITFLILFFCLSIISIANLAKASPMSQGVRVSVTIDEYLSYSIFSGQLKVATNSPAGFYLINDNQIVKVFGPTIQTITLNNKPMIITTNF